MPSQSIGADFARALADKDAERLRALVHTRIDFRGLTPNRSWEAGDLDSLLAILFEGWFEDSDEIVAVETIDEGAVSDRERVGYRFAVRNPGGDHVVEQQAYLEADDGRIVWMRVVCSGFRPAG